MNDYKMYNMNHEKRGVALVINIRSYDPPYQHKERVWSVKDFENLQHTFKYLEFDFEPCENLTAKEIRDKIQKMKITQIPIFSSAWSCHTGMRITL
jgi:hypothetical protein